MTGRVSVRVFVCSMLVAMLAAVPQAAHALPSGWAASDIGGVSAAGSADGSGDWFAVRGSGADIWGSADSFHYVYRTLTGDGTIVAQVSSVDYTHQWAKAGVMMRDSLAAGAAHAYMLVSAGKGVAFQRRTYAYGGSENTSAGGSAPMFVKLVRQGGTFHAYSSYDGGTWTFVGSESISMGSTIYVGLAVTSHANGVVAGASFNGVSVTSGDSAPSGSLPGGWSTADVGSVGAAGSSDASSGAFVVRGSGADIWGSQDGFHFAYRTLTGDGSISAQVSGIDYVHAWTKAGVMMRDSLDASSAHAFMLLSAGKGLAFQRRSYAGGASSSTSGGGASGAYFVKLTRSGNTFTAYASADGYNWSTVGSEYISMSSTIHVGFAVTSHAGGSLAGATFGYPEVTEGGSGDYWSEAPAPSVPDAPTYVAPPVYSPSGGTSLRVLHWNVHHGGIGTDGSYDPWRVGSWVARMNPDVISLNEVDDWSQVGAIVAAVTANTGQLWNFAFSGWGNLIMTTLPLYNQSICLFNAGAGRVAAHLSTVVNGRTLNIWSAHLAVDSASARLSEAYSLQNCAAGWDEARIIAGDYNMQYGSSEYYAATSNYTDAWLAASAAGATSNYSGNCDGCTRNSRIDYIFSSASAWFLSVQSAEIVDTRDGYGYMPSDHKPLVVTYQVQ